MIDKIKKDIPDEIQPIELTCKILDNVGFELVCDYLDDYEYVYNQKNKHDDLIGLTICLDNFDAIVSLGYWEDYKEYRCFSISPIKYLHELQRAFLVLFGKELDISKLSEELIDKAINSLYGTDKEVTNGTD